MCPNWAPPGLSTLIYRPYLSPVGPRWLEQSLPTSSADSTPALFSTAYWAKDILPTAFFTVHPLYVPPQLCGVLSRAMHQLVLDIITISVSAWTEYQCVLNYIVIICNYSVIELGIKYCVHLTSSSLIFLSLCFGLNLISPNHTFSIHSYSGQGRTVFAQFV